MSNTNVFTALSVGFYLREDYALHIKNQVFESVPKYLKEYKNEKMFFTLLNDPYLMLSYHQNPG